MLNKWMNNLSAVHFAISVTLKIFLKSPDAISCKTHSLRAQPSGSKEELLARACAASFCATDTCHWNSSFNQRGRSLQGHLFKFFLTSSGMGAHNTSHPSFLPLSTLNSIQNGESFPEVFQLTLPRFIREITIYDNYSLTECMS